MNDVLAGQMHAIGRSPVLTLGGTMLPLVVGPGCTCAGSRLMT